MRTYEKIMNKCEILLENKYADLAQIEVRIDEKETQRRELWRKLDHIRAAGTFEEYSEAKKEISRLDHDLERLQEWKANFEKSKLISSEEYEALIQEATDEVRAEVDALAAEMVQLAETYHEKGEVLRALITLINRRALPSDLWETVSWACGIAESYQYEKHTGKKIRKEG